MKIYEINTENNILGVYPIDDYYENPKYNQMKKEVKKNFLKMNLITNYWILIMKNIVM